MERMYPPTGSLFLCVSSNATEPENVWPAKCTVEYVGSLHYNEIPVCIPANSETDGTIIGKV